MRSSGVVKGVRVFSAVGILAHVGASSSWINAVYGVSALVCVTRSGKDLPLTFSGARLADRIPRPSKRGLYCPTL